MRNKELLKRCETGLFEQMARLYDLEKYVFSPADQHVC